MSVPPYEIVIVGEIDSPKDAIRSLLHSTLTHMAKVQTTMLEVLSRKYGHSVEEMVEVLRDSSEFNPQQLDKYPDVSSFVETILPVKKEMKTKKGKKVILKSE